MIQFCDESFLKSFMEGMGTLDDKISAKKKAIKDLEFELGLLQSNKADRVNAFLKDTMPFRGRMDGLVSSFDNNAGECPKMTQELKDGYECVMTAVFDDGIIKEYKPKLISTSTMNYNADSWIFTYLVGGRSVEFEIPSRYVFDPKAAKDEGGMLIARYEEKKYRNCWNRFVCSYCEKDIRKAVSEWVRKNCKKGQ